MIYNTRIVSNELWLKCNFLLINFIFTEINELSLIFRKTLVTLLFYQLYIIVQKAILNLILICTTRVTVGSYNVMNTIEHRLIPPAARYALKQSSPELLKNFITFANKRGCAIRRKHSCSRKFYSGLKWFLKNLQ
jgi:hypothetical protein